MRQAGIEGVCRRKRLRTTRPDPTAPRPPDLVQRDFTAARPNELWVTDLTYVPTWAGVAYVCFIVDAFSRMIVGWRVASHMRTGMVLDALEMARWSRGTQLEGLRCHSDAGGQFTSIRYGERLASRDRPWVVGSSATSFTVQVDDGFRPDRYFNVAGVSHRDLSQHPATTTQGLREQGGTRMRSTVT